MLCRSGEIDKALNNKDRNQIAPLSMYLEYKGPISQLYLVIQKIMKAIVSTANDVLFFQWEIALVSGYTNTDYQIL